MPAARPQADPRVPHADHHRDLGRGFADPGGSVERRVDPARIVFDGTVHPDVQTVTIRTPRDVRTIVPSSPRT